MSRDCASSRQVRILVREIEKTPLLSGTRGSLNMFDKLAYQEQWEMLAKKLNSVKKGARKSCARWQQKWRDLKYGVRKKCSQNTEKPPKLTKMELRIIKLGVKAPNFKWEDYQTCDDIIDVDSLSSDQQTIVGSDSEYANLELAPDENSTLADKNLTIGNEEKTTDNDTAVTQEEQKDNPFPNEKLAEQIVDGLSRLGSTISASAEKQTKLLEIIATNVVKLNVTLERNADLNKRIDDLEARLTKFFDQQYL